MQYVLLAAAAFAFYLATRRQAGTRLPTAEIERDTAFAALQRLAINQQRIIDSTEAKLGVLALAVLGLFIGLLVEANMERATWHNIWTILLGLTMLPILAGMLGFKAEEPFDVPSFVAGLRFQAPGTIDRAIEAMARRYEANGGRREIKERLLAISTWLAMSFAAAELARRFDVSGALVQIVGRLAASASSAASVMPHCGIFPF